MISKEEVEHIAKLARLELTEKEVGKMHKDLTAILDYFIFINFFGHGQLSLLRFWVGRVFTMVCIIQAIFWLESHWDWLMDI